MFMTQNKASWFCSVTLGSLLLSASTQPSTAQTVYSYQGKQTQYQVTVRTTSTNNATFQLVIREGEQLVQLSNQLIQIGTHAERTTMGKLLGHAVNSQAIRFTAAQVLRWEQEMDLFLDQVTARLDFAEMATAQVQSLCFARSFVRGLGRRIANRGGTVTCTMSESFVRQLSSLVCEEDQVLTLKELQEYVAANPERAANLGSKYLLDVFKRTGATSFRESEMKVQLNRYFSETMENRQWPSGSACGCCGNYSGPCIVWSQVCLSHDLKCQKCIPRWYCLSGCKPTPCTSFIF